MLRWALGLLLILAAITGLILGVLNPDPVSLDLAFFQLTISLGALIAAAIGFGLVLGLILGPLIFIKNRPKQVIGQSRSATVVDQNSNLNG